MYVLNWGYYIADFMFLAYKYLFIITFKIEDALGDNMKTYIWCLEIGLDSSPVPSYKDK